MTRPRDSQSKSGKRGRKRREHAKAMVQRLVKYHDYLQMRVEQDDGMTFTSTELAGFVRCECSVVRRDFSQIGVTGQPKVGYPLHASLLRLETVLGRRGVRKAALFGVGRLGGLLLRQDLLEQTGVVISVAFEADSAKIGTAENGTLVFDVLKAVAVMRQLDVSVAILAVRPEAAQECADRATAAGVRAIWSFAPCALEIPSSVAVRYENLTAGLTDLLYSIGTRACG